MTDSLQPRVLNDFMDQANNVVDGLAMYLRVIRGRLSFVIKDEWG